ncbi:Haemolymph juvenile hormone binding [Cinara cedri]|uniref:Haemolymph juvenile hormone binding n=1 Tax=Cinara cedri TaxID=506608 RepID=A0A5E4M0E0_9HEMI|nr:Haemolymph juvenile hormone binding [Cinara cedri]
MATTSTVKLFFSLTSVLLCAVNAAPSSKLPKDFVVCKLKDPALNECIKNGLQSSIPLLSKGVPNLGLLPLDPMRITTLDINQGTGSVKIKLSLKDVEILNFHTLVIDELNCDPKTYSLNLTLHTKEPIRVESLYTSKGSILIMPINGNGTLKIAYDDFKANIRMVFKPELKNGNTYLVIETFYWGFTTSKMHQSYTNLIGGNKALKDNVNLFLNENWEEVLNDFKPAITEALSEYFITIAHQFFIRIPLEKMFVV